jgi:hypothetical protein
MASLAIQPARNKTRAPAHDDADWPSRLPLALVASGIAVFVPGQAERLMTTPVTWRTLRTSSLRASRG